MRAHHVRSSFHDRVRAQETLCAVAALTAESTNLPRAADVADALGYDASELLVYLARKGLLNAYGPTHDSFFSLSPAGSRAVTNYCRRRA